MKHTLLVIVGIPAFLWVALFLSGFGILVETDVRRGGYDYTYCSHFVGNRIVTTYLGKIDPGPGHTPLNCPRWHRLGG
jgi:hypothetical protein